MINKKNWLLMKKYLNYRLNVDQISNGSLKTEQTYMRYILEWASERPFRQVMTIRPTLPEYMLTTAQEGKEKPFSAGYIKKTLATARLFFIWLSDNQPGHKHIRQGWIKAIKVKRLTEAPKTKDAVTLEEIIRMAGAPAASLVERRARAAAVFLYLSGMRIGAFVSMPIQAVDIPNRKVTQYPSLGVRTKNSKYGITYLLDIPELLKVVQEWDSEVRSVLPSNGFWFAPFSPDNGQIDIDALSVGEHRINLARRNIKAWLENVGLPYKTPHKFRHGHIQYGLARAKSIADFKAVSMNAMHASMEITDEFYSNLNDGEVQSRIGALGKETKQKSQDDFAIFQEFLEWRRSQEK